MDVLTLCSSVVAFLFPIFASYKALKANDQHQLTPWLMYWVVIACVVTVENFLGWFLNLYVPLIVLRTEKEVTVIPRIQGYLLTVARSTSNSGSPRPCVFLV
jgi:hypothetical protein